MRKNLKNILEKIKWKEYRKFYIFGIFVLITLVTLFGVFKPLSGVFYNIDYSASRKEALGLFHTGDIQGAIRKFKSIIEKEPDDIISKSYLALAYMQVGRFKEAEELLIDVIDRDENNIGAIYRLGVVSRYLGKIPESVENLKKAVELQGDNMMFREELIKSLISSSDHDSTLSEIRTIIRHKKASSGRIYYYWEQLGDVYLKKQEQNDAISAYRKSLALGKNERVRKKLDSLLKNGKP